MASKDAHDDMPNQQRHTLVLEARPEIQVFVAKNERISIVVHEIREDMDGVTSDVVQIPIDCAQQVGEALIKIAESYNAQ